MATAVTELWFWGDEVLSRCWWLPAASRQCLSDQLGCLLPGRGAILQLDTAVLAKLSVFKQQNRPKNLILPGERESGGSWHGGEQPGRKAGHGVCLPSFGLPPKGGIFLCEVAGHECEWCSAVCRLALSVLGADVPREASLHPLPLLSSPRDRDSPSISLCGSAFVVKPAGGVGEGMA